MRVSKPSVIDVPNIFWQSYALPVKMSLIPVSTPWSAVNSNSIFSSKNKVPRFINRHLTLKIPQQKQHTEREKQHQDY